MESQRSNTNIAYSWIVSIFLVLSTGLFYYGTIIEETGKFIPVMLLALSLAIVWWGLTETFIFYIRQRMRRIHEIEKELNIKLMSEAGEEIKKLGWKAKFREVRNYVRFFIFAYAIIWLLMLVIHPKIFSLT